MGGASIAANLSNVRLLEHLVGGASIAANRSHVRFLEHPLPTLVTFGSWSIRWEEHPSLATSVPLGF